MRQQVKVDCFNCQLALFFVFPGLFFFCLCPCQRVSCNVTKFKFLGSSFTHSVLTHSDLSGPIIVSFIVTVIKIANNHCSLFFELFS